MRIDPSAIVNQIQSVKGRGIRGPKGADGVSSDSVTLSDLTQDFKTAMAAIASAPAVREDRITSLRQQIDDGQYDISEEDIAAKLLGNRNAE